MPGKPVKIRDFVPDPSMSSVTTEELEEIDKTIDALIQDSEEKLANAKPVVPRSVFEATSIMTEEGEDSDGGNEREESGSSDDGSAEGQE